MRLNGRVNAFELFGLGSIPTPPPALFRPWTKILQLRNARAEVEGLVNLAPLLLLRFISIPFIAGNGGKYVMAEVGTHVLLQSARVSKSKDLRPSPCPPVEKMPAAVSGIEPKPKN